MTETKNFYDKFSSESAIKSYVAGCIAEDPKLKEKLDTLKDRVHKHIPAAERHKRGRDLTREEYAIFFASVSLVHFRNDVITSFYTPANEVKNYYDKAFLKND
ncbi:hypothetical protein [Priestia megaterium]|uniref:hypothetical protein n=1 Tax=Priestia megaterium TaxID=1404 RepID=UPI0032D93DBD